MEDETNEMMVLKLAAIESYLNKRRDTIQLRLNSAKANNNPLLTTQQLSRKFEIGLMVLFWDDLDKCKSPNDVIRALERANVKTDIVTERSH